MSKKSRLFLFASFNKDGVISDSLLYYLSNLSKYGDIVFIMDNPSTSNELDKIKKFVIYAKAERHGEYDFGSYKRGYEYALKQNILDNYDYVYFVNDSVYGPIGLGLGNAIDKMEQSGCGFIGMVSNKARKLPKHIQSWFVGISTEIAKTAEFRVFMLSVAKQANKWDIITKYEIGLSKLLNKLTGNKMYVVFEQNNKSNPIYKKPWKLLEKGVPFLKKIAIKKTISYEFLEKMLNNDILFNEIQREAPEIEHRPITEFFLRLFRRSMF